MDNSSKIRSHGASAHMMFSRRLRISSFTNGRGLVSAMTLDDGRKRPPSPPKNDGRAKMASGGAIIEWDQADVFAILAEASAKILGRRRDLKLHVRGLIDALNREAKLTKRGEPYVGSLTK